MRKMFFTVKTAFLLGLPVLVVGSILALTACAGNDQETSKVPFPSTSELHGELTVYAAASLNGALNALTAEFSKMHPGITFAPTVYDGSSTLATQIIAGAPADIFASADERTMATVVDASLIDGDPVLFATNELVIAVAPGNPLGIRELADLTGSGQPEAPIVVMCAREVPCGNASRTLFAAATVTLTPASEEQNVSAVLAKVRGGEADAGLVYRTDVMSARGEVESVDIAGSAENPNRYPIGVVQGSSATPAAAAFCEFIRTAEARKLLVGLGFGTP
jgi:molybdate transport system substrate-binding protein